MQKPRKTRFYSFLAASGLLVFLFTHVITIVPAGEEAANNAAYAAAPLTKEEAAEAAEEFLRSRLGRETVRTFAAFQADLSLSGYVQKYGLMNDFRKRYAGLVALDYYAVELTEPLNGKRYLVEVDAATGKITGWRFLDAPHDRQPDRNKSRTIAESFVQSAGFSLSRFRLVQADSAEEGVFLFQSREDRLGGAVLQLRVEVLADRVTAFRSEFSIPREHLLWEEQQSAVSYRIQRWNQLVFLLLGIAAFIFAVKHRHAVTWTRGIVLTWLFLLISGASHINMYPAIASLFIAEKAGDVYTIAQITINLVVSCATAIVVYLAFVSGDALWTGQRRALWPKPADPDFAGHTFRAMGKGYAFGCFLLGLQSVLLWAGDAMFHIWTVNDPLFSNENLLLPAIFPLTAWSAAISEEAVFRLFALALFMRWFKSAAIAALCASFLWALGHAAYPVFPVYTRLLEVTVLGLFFSAIFLKHGFAASLFAHAAFNSILMALSIMSMGGGLNICAGILYIASPAAVAGVICLRHHLQPGRLPPLRLKRRE
jgi:hypothetical protein